MFCLMLEIVLAKVMMSQALLQTLQVLREENPVLKKYFLCIEQQKSIQTCCCYGNNNFPRLHAVEQQREFFKLLFLF